MTATDSLANGAARGREDRRRAGTVALAQFTVTIFLSALLLFSIQPMFAKMVLPTLGGSPSVWAVSMVFFQATLLAGYAYADALNRWAKPNVAVLLHLVVLMVALLALPIALPAFASQPVEGAPYAWLIAVLAFGVGLPFFAVSANAPLLQSWFRETGHKHAEDPYFLYGASNLGSLIALLSYPIVIEPLIGASAQAAFWSAGYVALTVAIAASGYVVLRSQNDSRSGGMLSELQKTADARDASMLGFDTAKQSATDASTPQNAVAAPSVQDRLWWIALAFVPSALLVAFTTFITTDIASVPFLWVLPLALFLGTFSIVFCAKPVIPHRWLLKAQPYLVAVTLFGFAMLPTMIAATMAVALLAFLGATLTCHRELYLRRPDARLLTRFYLWMSLGGVLGGMFSALFAPLAFSSPLEFPLLLIAGLALMPGFWPTKHKTLDLGFVAIVLIGGLIAYFLLDQMVSDGAASVSGWRKMTLIGLGITALVFARDGLLQAACLAAIIGVSLIPIDGRGTVEQTRNFYGVLRVSNSADGAFRILRHGTTIHGAERLADDAGNPLAAPIAGTYYAADGPMSQVLAGGRAHHKAAAGADPFRVGVVGLGIGAMSCYKQPGETWRYFEIDADVARFATDPKLFRMMDHCDPDADIVLGDARLTLQNETPHSFDYLQIDAFSSDAIPVHLLTREALQLYLDRVADTGVLIFHVSNRHMNLAPVIAANLATLPGYHAVRIVDEPAAPSLDHASSEVVVVSRDAAALTMARSLSGAGPLSSARAQPWTDDFSNILSALTWWQADAKADATSDPAAHTAVVGTPAAPH